MSADHPESMALSLDRYFQAGRQVEVLPRRSELFDAKQVRQSVVLGVEKGDLVLSMPDPPLSGPLLGQALEITFLLSVQEQAKRFGYYTLILDTLDKFPALDDAQKGMVVFFPTEKDLLPTNLRNTKRYRVKTRRHLALRVAGFAGVRLRDISLKGLRFSFSARPESVEPEQKIGLQLVIQGEEHTLYGRVVEITQQQQGGELRLELDSLPLDLWSYLLQVLHDLEKSGKVAAA